MPSPPRLLVDETRESAASCSLAAGLAKVSHRHDESHRNPDEGTFTSSDK